ncbi:MAG: hypothetical protein ACXVCE_13235 [Bacteriovorax sp.]
MFEKFITNLKQSLPEPLRKKLGMEDKDHIDEEASEHSEEQSEEHFEEPSKESHDTSDNSGDISPEDKKKKQISMLIRVVIVVGLGYIAVTEFVLKPNDNEVPVVAVKPRKHRKKAPLVTAETKPKEAKPAEAKPVEAKQDEKAAGNIAATPASETKPEEEKNAGAALAGALPPVENINIAEKKSEEAPAAGEEPKAIDDTPILKNSPAETAPQVGEVRQNDSQAEKSLDNLIDGMGGAEKSVADQAKKKETKLEEKIVADDVYTAPPSYEQLGRGLVYNCKEKYWACIDKTAYIACNKNMKWNKAHGKEIECAVQNVYNSEDDCGVVQKYNVSTNKTTSFCK